MSTYESLRDIDQEATYYVYKNSLAEFHFHQCLELVYVLSGSLTVTINGTEIVIAENNIAFIPAYFPHAVRPNEETKSITYIIPYYYYKVFVNRKIPLIFLLLNNCEVNKKILQLMNDSVSFLPNQPNIQTEGYITTILALITASYPPLKLNSKTNAIMIDIINYINENYRNDLSLEKLAEHFNYSKFHFSKLFNETFKCNLKTYINTVRANQVITNLSTDSTVTDTIFSQGFNSTSTFYRNKHKLKK